MSYYSLLLVQSDPEGASAIREALTNAPERSFTVKWVRNCAEALIILSEQHACQTGRLSAVLVDLSLPDGHGIEAFDRLFHASAGIPILVLSDANDEDTARLAVERGAQDYLLKGHLDSYLLPKAIRSMVERAANADELFNEKERAQVTLNSIGDAVVSTDVGGIVTYLNGVAEVLTGWPLKEARGWPLETVFNIVDAKTGEAVENPMAVAVRENRTVALNPNCLLIRRDGTEVSIEDSAAPIHDRHGTVTGAVMVFHDVSVARALSLRTVYMAQHDTLTDLPNRALLEDRLGQAIALARRHHRQLALLFLDLDRFKQVNDTLGHVVGDRLLRMVAQRLLGCVRSSDTVGRQGGDEFIVLLSEVTRQGDAAICADKIQTALQAPFHLEGRELHVSASIGIVSYPENGSTVDALLNNADLAMYQAKEKGRGRYQYFSSDMALRATERQSIEDGLRLALAQHEFVLHYQPKINLETGAIVGVEALIRWRQPDGGLMAPLQFISTAEQCGLIVPVGQWVMREACRQARAWQDAALPAIPVAVNVSGVELRTTGFLAGVHAILAETGLDPRYLEIELTETSLMEESMAVASVLQGLKEVGVGLALDDFGTGYSSLSYLKRFPVDTLKIDQSFVRDIVRDADDASIVSAVISMGRDLNIQVVAEGVETQEQCAFLKAKQCPEGQGYYFNRPMAVGDFAQLLMASA